MPTRSLSCESAVVRPHHRTFFSREKGGAGDPCHGDDPDNVLGNLVTESTPTSHDCIHPKCAESAEQRDREQRDSREGRGFLWGRVFWVGLGRVVVTLCCGHTKCH